jgi:hypothetical protein
MNTEVETTPTYIQVLQAELAKMDNDNVKGLFAINKYTLNRIIKLLIRDEAVRTTSRNFQRSKNPEGKTRELHKKEFLVKPINF